MVFGALCLCAVRGRKTCLWYSIALLGAWNEVTLRVQAFIPKLCCQFNIETLYTSCFSTVDPGGRNIQASGCWRNQINTLSISQHIHLQKTRDRAVAAEGEKTWPLQVWKGSARIHSLFAVCHVQRLLHAGFMSSAYCNRSQAAEDSKRHPDQGESWRVCVGMPGMS